MQVQEFDAEGQLTFEGEYREGVKHGSGILYLEDGGVMAGSWEAGELSGECRLDRASTALWILNMSF